VAPDLSPASHAGNIKLERYITRGDPLEGGPSNPSSASHEPLSGHRQPPPRQGVALGLQWLSVRPADETTAPPGSWHLPGQQATSSTIDWKATGVGTLW